MINLYRSALLGVFAFLLNRPAPARDRPETAEATSPTSTFSRPGLGKSAKFWVVNFGAARTLAPGKIGFAAGMGGQVVFVGDPRRASAFFTIPHAGFRVGLGPRTDAGLRLAPIPLPYASVGPGFGINFDVKHCFTAPGSRFDVAVVLGAGGAYVRIDDASRSAYSPNAAALVTQNLNPTTHLTLMGRYVYLAIPTAPQGARGNFVNITGLSVGLKKDIRPTIALLPELGAYWYDGAINNVPKKGPGFQYGLMIATSF